MTNALPPIAGTVHLTDALRAAGALDTGRVRGVALMAPPIKKLRSQSFRLRLDYEGKAEAAPASVILKTGHLDDAGRPIYSNPFEIAFYRDIAPVLPAGSVPRCFDVTEAAETSTWGLLLEDLTETHFVATEWPLPPATAHCGQIVQALARIHAAWWDDARLGVTVGRWRDEAIWAKEFSAALARFTERFGHLLPAERHELYQQLIDRAPALSTRHHGRRNLTVTHGDAHVWNFFLPHDGHETVRLLDWESWNIAPPTDDLAYMMAMLWYPDRRHRLEQPLLDHYHAALAACGIDGYDRKALADDYRLSVLWLITRPVWQATHGIGARVWWNNLERIFLAVDDLGCRDLLG
jgi:ecdysteroid kinase